MNAETSGTRYRNAWRALWGRALRDNATCCHYCGVALTPRNATIDHLTPISRGGAAYAVENMALCCQPCNHAKGALTEAEYRADLAKEPRHA